MIAATTHTPRNRTATELIAEVSGFTFRASDSDFVILTLGDGSKALGNQPSDWFHCGGQRYRFLGRWEHGPRGEQFRFGSVVRDEPFSKEAVIKYLSDVCPGIGRARAVKLYEHYGNETTRTLREQPAKVAADGVLSEEVAGESAAALEALKQTESTRIDLHGLFAGRGFPAKLTEACIGRWGVKAPANIRRNPFVLLTGSLPGAGFKRCDKLWLDTGHSATALKRQVLVAWDSMRKDSQGHTWFEAKWAVDLIANEFHNHPSILPVKALRAGLRAGLLAKREETGAKWLTAAPRAKAEARIADALARLRKARALWPLDIPVSAIDGDGLPSVHQVGQLTAAMSGPVGLFCGSPGTGKTHSLAFALQRVIQDYGRESVAVCAPTGKAAVRATQSLMARGITIKATTIHQLLKIGSNGHVTGDWGFQHNRDEPLPRKFVIVDESSMIDCQLMADLLDALAVGTHILFVGDPHQLPPVGHGAPLRDMIAAGLPYGELTEVRRNAGQIVHACLDIKAGKDFTASTDSIDLPSGRNLLHFPAAGEKDALDKLTRMLLGMKSFHPVTQTQIIVARNKGGLLTRKELNAGLQKLLNPAGRSCPKCPFLLGDKVICLRNARMHQMQLKTDLDEADATTWETVREEGQPKETYIANGEIGYVLAVGPSFAVASFGEGEPVRVNFSRQKTTNEGESEDEADSISLAYAVTTHKCQGSESPCIIVVADEGAGMIAGREWWYTAISRASKLCVILGAMSTVQKQTKKIVLKNRKTFLKELILKGAS